MPANRLIKSEVIILHPGQARGLTSTYIPPKSPNTRSATITVLKGGPMYFDATEGQAPSSDTAPAELGDELDVIGSEDLRLVQLMAAETTNLAVSYFGGGDQI